MGSSPIPVAKYISKGESSLIYMQASVAQLVEQRTENPRVVGSIPTGGTKDIKKSLLDYILICGFSSSGRAPPCQGGGSEFEPRNPLQHGAIAKW